MCGGGGVGCCPWTTCPTTDATLLGGGAHGDWHDLWIDPDNPKHVLGGDDGGF